MTPRRASDFVAERVKQIRQRRGLTAEGLAARCAEIGTPEITRSVIANIETGRKGPDGRRRRETSVDELLVLAYALQVPPLLLLAPLDGADQLQVTGSVQMDVLRATAWLAGQDQAAGFYGPGTLAANQRQDATPMMLLRRILAALDRAETVRRANASKPEQSAGALANIGQDIGQDIAWLMSLGFAPPPLPPDVAEFAGHAHTEPGEGG